MEWVIRQNRLMTIEAKIRASHKRLWDRTTAALNGNMWHRYMILSQRCHVVARRQYLVSDAIFACFPKGRV